MTIKTDHILNQDVVWNQDNAGLADWTVIEQSGDRVLLKTNQGLAKLRDFGKSKAQDIYDQSGQPLKLKQGKWTIVAAERFEQSNLLALRHKSNKKIKIWNFNKHWRYQSTSKTIKVSSKEFLKQEQRFSQKLTSPTQPDRSTEPNPTPTPQPEPNQPALSTWASNEPLFRYQWGLFNDGSLAGSKKDADTDSYDFFRSIPFPITGVNPNAAGRNVIAVIDTGVNLEHLDLKGNLQRSNDVQDGFDNDGNGFIDDIVGYDFVNQDADPVDDHGHGSHVAGVAAAAANGTGIVGANPVAKILPIKVMDQQGSGSTANIIRGINYALQRGAKILNLSLGSSYADPAMQLALQQAQNQGVLILASAGNDGKNIDQEPQYPASFALQNIITVAASTPDDSIAGYSNIGPNHVDLLAPGSSIYSAWKGSPTAIQVSSGTSMATPFVAGAVSAFWSRHIQFTPAQVKQRLLTTVDPLGEQNKVLSGGRINMARLMGVRQEVNTTRTIMATVDPLIKHQTINEEAKHLQSPSFNINNLDQLPKQMPDQVITFVQGGRQQRKQATAQFSELVAARKGIYEGIEQLDVMSALANKLAVVNFDHDLSKHQKIKLLQGMLSSGLIDGVELEREVRLA